MGFLKGVEKIVSFVSGETFRQSESAATAWAAFSQQNLSVEDGARRCYIAGLCMQKLSEEEIQKRLAIWDANLK